MGNILCICPSEDYSEQPYKKESFRYIPRIRLKLSNVKKFKTPEYSSVKYRHEFKI